jgi:hypothetical protein
MWEWYYSACNNTVVHMRNINSGLTLDEEISITYVNKDVINKNDLPPQNFSMKSDVLGNRSLIQVKCIFSASHYSAVWSVFFWF